MLYLSGHQFFTHCAVLNRDICPSRELPWHRHCLPDRIRLFEHVAVLYFPKISDFPAAEVCLDCQVIDHKERVEFVEMLGVDASAALPLIISVRVTPKDTHSQTEVWGHCVFLECSGMLQ